MKLRNFFFFTLVFAALVFCISCGGKGNKYPDIDDDILTDDDQLPEDDADTDTKNDEDKDTTPVNDNDPSDDPHHDSDKDDTDTAPDETDADTEPDDNDTDTTADTEPDDSDTDTHDDTDTEPDETGDEDSIPEKDDPTVICTDQSQCFNSKKEITCPTSPDADFFGQDVQYANKGYCLMKSYTTSSDLVTDNITGLVWQRKLPETGCPNHGEGTNIIVCTKQEAVDYCSNLNYAGYSDWRLPTPEEYATIKNFGSIPAIGITDENYFPLPSTTTTIFWTSASSLASSGKSWAVDFQTGETTEQDDTKASSTFYVRCVRGEELAKPDFKTFTENNEVIVYDNTHNLKWTKTLGEEVIWKAALKYCEDLEYAGETEWRLPNINELASIIDYSRSNPASLFPGLTSPYLWSSTTYIGYPSSAWIADMSSGTVQFNTGKTVPFKVICVK